MNLLFSNLQICFTRDSNSKLDFKLDFLSYSFCVTDRLVCGFCNMRGREVRGYKMDLEGGMSVMVFSMIYILFMGLACGVCCITVILNPSADG